MGRFTAEGCRMLAAQYRPYDPDVLALHPGAADILRGDPAIAGRVRVDRIEGCELVLDDRLPANGWELRRGIDMIASGIAGG